MRHGRSSMGQTPMAIIGWFFYVSSAFPHEGIEDATRAEPESLIELNGVAIGLRHGQRKFGETTVEQTFQTGTHHGARQSMTAKFGQQTNLRYVSHVFAHTRAQQHSYQRTRSGVDGGQRGCGIEGSTSGKSHDVVQETQRSGDAAILIVDL